MKKTVCVLFCLMCAAALAACSVKKENTETSGDVNPCKAEWITAEMQDSLKSLKRIDDKGYMYEMDYSADYYTPALAAVADQMAASIQTGCSAFSAYNTDKDYLFCRNYDYNHKDADGNSTGLSIVLHTAPEGKLRSIGVCDAYWLNTSSYYAAALDDGKTDISALALAPYMCVDGMNEAGLAASLLVVDLKDGESFTNQNTGKERAVHSQLLRYIIDNAHNIDEAVKIAESYDVHSAGDTDLHMYIADKSGSSAVFEWRQYECDSEQKLYVTYTNAVTNFFTGFDDAEDVYSDDGSLKELFSGFSSTFNKYKYGYGHGYHRFNTIVASLERYIEPADNGHGIRNSIMEEDQALDVLRVISQNPGTEKTSLTQYSAIYNLEDLSVSFRLMRNYDKVYTFTLF